MKIIKPNAELVTARDIAAQAGVGSRTVRRWVEKGLLPAPVLKSGKTARWSGVAIDKALGVTQ